MSTQADKVSDYAQRWSRGESDRVGVGNNQDSRGETMQTQRARTGSDSTTSEKHAVTVGIVEDDVVTRDRLRRTIEASQNLSIVFAAGTVKEAIAGLDANLPAVMLVDLRLPDGDGTEILQHMREHHESVLAMVISALGDELSVVRAIKAGAMGYLLKDDSEETIESSIQQLLEGGSPISPPIARHLIQHFVPADSPADKQLQSGDTLSPRELDVLTFAAKGYSYQEVASLLGVSPNTVSSYTKRIYEKLEVNSRNEALFEATRLGLVSPPERE